MNPPKGLAALILSGRPKAGPEEEPDDAEGGEADIGLVTTCHEILKAIKLDDAEALCEALEAFADQLTTKE